MNALGVRAPSGSCVRFGLLCARRCTLSVACALGFGCADPEGARPAYEIVDSAGIRIVMNPSGDQSLQWTLVEVHSIGGTVNDAGPFNQVSPYGVGADQEANVYILDNVSKRVIAFDTSGVFVRKYGGPGQGPGEFDFPLNLSVSAAGVVSVYDWRKRGFVSFDKAGTILPERRLAIPYNGQKLTLVDSLVLFTSWPPGGQGFQGLAVLNSANQISTLVEAPSPLPRPRRIERCGIDLPIGPVFASELLWAANARRAAVNAWHPYRVDVYENTRHVLSIRRRVQPVQATEADAIEEVGDEFTFSLPSGRCTVPPAEVVATFGYEETLPSVADVRITPEGMLWIARRSSPSSVLIDVFDRDGAYLGTLPPGTAFPTLFIAEDLVGIVETDSLGVQRLSIKEVRREPGARPDSKSAILKEYSRTPGQR